MYKIIGGDGQEYGPVTEADLRTWISEGRLNAQSLAKSEGDAEFRALSTFPEFTGLLGGVYGALPPSLRDVDWSSRDYELDIGGCFSRGWDLFKNNVGILLGSSLLYFVMVIILSAILGFVFNAIFLAIFPREALQTAFAQISRDLVFRVVSSLVLGPLTGGIYYLFIQAMRGKPAGVGDLFVGFQRTYPQLFLGYLIFTLTAAACLVPYVIVEMSRLAPMLSQLQPQHGPVPPQQALAFLSQMFGALAGTLPVLLLCLIPLAYLLTNIQFALPLIIDKEMNFWTAIKTSWRMVHKHWFTVFGLVFLMGLVNIGGVLMCCVGVLFTFAISTAAFVFAYETIFGDPPPS